MEKQLHTMKISNEQSSLKERRVISKPLMNAHYLKPVLGLLVMLLLSVQSFAQNTPRQSISGVAIDPAQSVFCADDPVSVDFTFNNSISDSTYTVTLQLSNAAGTGGWTNIHSGTVSIADSTNTGYTINGTIPSAAVAGTAYAIRLVFTGTGGTNHNFNVSVQTGIQIIPPTLTTGNMVQDDPFCVGDTVSVNFSATCLRGDQGFTLQSGTGSSAIYSGNIQVRLTSTTGGVDQELTPINGTGTIMLTGSTTLDGVVEVVIPTTIPSEPDYRFEVETVTADFSTDVNGGNDDGNQVISSLTITNISTILSTDSTICQGEAFTIDYSSNDTYNAGNIIYAELSDASGNFNDNTTQFGITNTIIGRIFTTATSGSIEALIPYDLPGGTDYQIRLRSSNEAFFGCVYGPITVPEILNIADQPDNARACLGDSPSFSVTPNSNTASPIYEWLQLCMDDPFQNYNTGLESGGVAINEFSVSGGIYYAATGAGIARSNDATGQTWTPYDNLNINYISDIFVSGASGTNRIYANDQNAIFVSSNLNTNTSFSIMTPSGVTSINDIYVDTDGIWLATDRGLFRNTSTDGSGTFSSVSPLFGISSTAVTRVGDITYVGTAQGLYILDASLAIQDQRTTLNTVGLNDQISDQDGIANDNIQDIFFDASTNTLVLGTSFGIAYSTDNAFSFTTIEEGLIASAVTDVYVHEGMIFAGTSDGIGVLSYGAEAFTLYNESNGLGAQSIGAILVTGTVASRSVQVGTLSGFSIGTLTTEAIVDGTTPPNITGQGLNTINLTTLTYDNVDCRYQVRISTEFNPGDTCSALSNIVRISNIPPEINLTEEQAISLCGGSDGQVKINGLVAGVQYELARFGDNNAIGTPDSSETVTADSSGAALISGLSAGEYMFAVRSLEGVFPDNNCISNTEMIELMDPVPPTTPQVTGDTVCIGENIVVTLPAMEPDSVYQFFLDSTGAMPASPSQLVANGTNALTYTLSSVPTAGDSIYYTLRDNDTQCNGDTLFFAYEVINAPPISKRSSTNTSANGGSDGEIVLEGFQLGDDYRVEYALDGGAPTTVNITSATADSLEITGLSRGIYSITVTYIADNGQECSLSSIPYCPILDPDDLLPVDDEIQLVAETVDTVCGKPATGTYGYLQFTDNDAGCSGGDQVVTDGGIAVGRVRDAQALLTNGAENIELRGFLQFDLSSIPEGAIIDQIEYMPVAADNFGKSICEVPVESMTGDVQFDVVDVDSLNYAPYLGIDQDLFDDHGQTKYADFTVSKDANAAWTTLRANAIKDVQDRLEKDDMFQIGLRLSGNDFDLALYQFYGIVFANADQHKLRVTYHFLDYGDLPTPYVTTMLGGLAGPSHRIDSVDVDPDPAVTTRLRAMYIGATEPDSEADGQPSSTAMGDDLTDVNDEDLSTADFINPLTNNELFAGNSIVFNIPITNNLDGFDAKLSAYFDWNGDGLFNNAEERYDTTLTGPFIDSLIEMPIAIPITAVNDIVGVRVRVTTADIDAYGEAPNGEVEDFQTQVFRFDFGDLIDTSATTAIGDYQTIWTLDGTGGPRHSIDENLTIGTLIDAEGNGQPQAQAFGDDIAGSDDEDGITPPALIVRDQPAVFQVLVRNETGAPAYLNGFADWDNDGNFGGTNEAATQVLIPAGASGQYTVEFTVPPVPNPLPEQVAVRFRLGDLPTENGLATGPAAGTVLLGEVEDLLVNIAGFDWGDLEEPKFITDAQGGFPGPSHKISAIVTTTDTLTALYIGMTPPDAEMDGLPNRRADGDDLVDPIVGRVDDEDLSQANFINLATGNRLISGDNVTISVPVTNNTAENGYLLVFVDWNNNGEFEKETELYMDTVATGTSTSLFDVQIPATTPTDSIGVRVRFTTGEVFDAYGQAPDGEVEDFLILVSQYDYGDLPDLAAGAAQNDFRTIYDTTGVEGPRHVVNQDLRIGNALDAEADGQPQINAFGDDINGIDDEDGIITPDTIRRDVPAVFQVFVTNKTGQDAYLFGFVDWNDNGDFEDDPLEKSGAILIPADSSGVFPVTFTVPPMPVPLPERVGARFRLSNENTLAALSIGPDVDSDIQGEVHDLWVNIAGYDFGDLPEPRYITDNQGGFEGPSHKIVSDENGMINLWIGGTAPDAENQGIPSAMADGDDQVVPGANPSEERIDDEDLSAAEFVAPGTTTTQIVTAGEPTDFRVPVTNNTGRTATLWAFIDWNGDGDFKDEGETNFDTIGAATTSTTVVFEFDPVPPRPDADTIGVRVRLTTGQIFDAYGEAPDGEVEDFLIELNGADYGDLPDASDSLAMNDFQTYRIFGGPRHAVPVVPLVMLGDTVDTEIDGIPSADADGDDNNQIVNDEDGIIFLTPLIPGQSASIAYSAINNSDSVAQLFMFVDWNNNGELEQEDLSVFEIPANTTVSGQIAEFLVPNDATFDEGRAYFRFRLTTDTAFIASPTPLEYAQDGEVEDYYVPIFNIGNLVWEDRNHNGRQDEDEIPLGIENVRVVLRYGGVDSVTALQDGINQNTLADPNNMDLGADAINDYIFETYTDSNGLYNFDGLIEGFYQIIAIDTFDLTPSRADNRLFVTEEDLDSDGNALLQPWEYAAGDVRQSKTQVFRMDRDSIGTDEEGILDQLNPGLLDPNQVAGEPDNKVEQRIDFGYTAFDFGDLDTSYITVETGDSIGWNLAGLFPSDSIKVGNPLEGPKHIVTPDVYLGGCSDAETNAQPDPDAGQEVFPAADGMGDNPNASTWNSIDRYNPAGCGDDENGIEFLTPLVPGSEAIISVNYQTTVNDDGPDAYLQAYFDWNGDGDFYIDPTNPALGIDPNEQIIFTFKNDDTLILEPNTNAVELELSDQLAANPVILKFNVPADAVYQDGNFLGRFRIGKTPNMGPTGILPGNANFPDGIVPFGEVEDYFMNLVRTSNGNIVWEDRDYDGIQDEDEPVIPGVTVTLDYAGLDSIFGNDPFERTYTTVTDSGGAFIFPGLIGFELPSVPGSKYYRLTLDDPEDMTPTVNRDTFPFDSISNCVVYNSDGNDDNIDDLITQGFFRIDDPQALCTGEMDPLGKNDIGDFMVSGTNIWPDNQIDESIDFGYVGFDYGDLPDSTLGTVNIGSVLDSFDYRTSRDWLPSANNNMGPRHAVQPKLYLGAGVDAELNAHPSVDAGVKVGGDDADSSAFRKGLGADDESGIRLLTPLIPDEYAYIRVDYTSQDTVLAGGYADTSAFFNAFIDWNGDGDFYLDVNNPAAGYDPGEYVLFTHQGDTLDGIGAIAPTTNPELAGGVDTFAILGFRVPDTSITDYKNGTAFMRFRLSFEGQLDADNYRYHKDTPAHVILDTEPASTTVPAIDWEWAVATQTYPRGEVEDYAIPLAKVGNLAWYDHNVNGFQDSANVALYNDYMDEYGVDTLHLVLVYGGVNDETGAFDAVGYQVPMDTLETAGDVVDILYNLSIAPPAVGTYTPEYVKTSIDEGLYSFRGLIPGNYNLIPLKYLQRDSMSFVDFYPKHRVLTVKDNQFMSDSLDSDAGPGAVFTIDDINPNDPEVCVGDLPTGEDGALDMDDANDPFFPDNQYDQTIDFGWVDEPNVEANLDVTGVNFPTSEVCGNFNVKLHLCIKNPTEVPLDSILPILDLRAAYGQAFVATSKPIVTIVDSAFVTDPAGVKVKKSMVGAVGALSPFINASYNGDGNNNLLTGGDVNTDFFLPGDSVICIQIEFEINPDFYDAMNPWMAQAGVYARAVGFLYEDDGAGRTKTPLLDWQPNIDAGVANPRFGQYIEVFDLSDEFDDPTPALADNILFEGSVVDRGLDDLYITFPIPPSVTGRDKYLDENDKTVMNDSCWLFTENIAGFDLVNIPLGFDCQALIDPSVFISNHIAECGFDLYPNGSYYRVIIQDEHTGETLWSSDDRIPFDYGMYSDRKLIYKARSVVNHCTIIWGRMNFEDKVAPVAFCPADTNASLNTGLPLVCTDIDSVLNNPSTWLDPNDPYYTGIAIAEDNCGIVYFDGATDILEVLTDCQESADNGYTYARIIRTFLFRDEAGNTVNCRQVINFVRPEIILPVCNIFLNNDVVGDDTELEPADLIGKYEQPESVPYYFNANGDRVYLTEETACGFAINYETTARFIVDDCGFKIERTWSIFDWCYGTGSAYPDYLIKPSMDSACYDGITWTGNSYGWTQLIAVGDTLAPIVSIGDFDDDDTTTVNGYKGGPVADPTVTTETYDADDIFIFNTSGLECAANFSVTKDMFEVEEQGEWCFDLDIIVRQPVLDLDERPIPDSFEFVREPGVEVSGDCEGGYWVVGAPMELNPDRYYFFETRFYDNCGKDTLLYFPFRVIDTEKPNVICDDEIRVTYNNLGTGSLAAIDVDEGTTDNCGKILWLKVRRPVNDCAEGFRTMLSYVDANNNSIVDERDYIDENNNNRPDPLEYFSYDDEGVFMSPLLDEVPFFCCDGDSVKVELWASDKSGNLSSCWQWAILEDKPPLSLELPNNYILPNDADYDCTQEEDKVILVAQGGTHAEGSLTYNAAVALLQGDLFIPMNNTCPGISKQMIITPDIDNCGVGKIYINWILSNDEESYTTREFATITIEGKHDYWIKFPKDHYTNCATPNPDTVEVSTASCDLMAIAQLPDERFTTSLDPDVCYKIFRTYRVINWCEYDGESLPVIVSRDWDAHNSNGIECNQNANVEPSNGKDAFEAGEYNLNPDKPDGDGTPGDEDIYIIVEVDDLENTGIVYYDNDSDPRNNSTADLFGDDDVSDIDLVSGWMSTEVRSSTSRNDEGYWWAVTLNDRECDEAGSTSTSSTSGSRWEDRDPTDAGQGSPSQDDDDDRYGSHGFWQYTQHIIVYDEVDPELNIVGEEVYPSLSNTDCAGDVSFEIAAYDFCNGDTTNVVLQVIVDGQNATSKLVDGVYSDRLAQGDHMMIVTARDACGNVATSTIEFAVEDAKGPSPILHEDIVLELSTSTDTADAGGSGFVWATDFVASPIYDCNGQDDTDTNEDLELVTLYSINLVGDSVDVNQSGLKFTCDQVGQNVQVEVHAWDELGNHDFAIVEVIVQDNLGVCDQAAGDGQISGGVATEDNSRVNEVELSLSGASQPPYMTNATGSYSFTNLLEGFDYTVIPSKDHFHENGITTFDVILMQKHIVGSGLLDSPYKMIAADINKSGDISILDLIQLRKMILGIDSRFADNTSWRFVDAEYVFPNPSNPFEDLFPEVKNINNLEGAEEANFIAVKIGDLNGSAAAYVQPRTNKVFGITAKAETRLLKAGYDYRIDFDAADLAKVQGYQFSLELNEVELVDMDYGVAQAEHFAIFPQEDLITTSWNNIELDDQRLFSLIIRPENDMALEDALQISSRKTDAEAYNLQGQVMPIGLSLETGGQAELVNQLYQNRPNPFLGETLVRFQLGQGGQISLKVRDVRGRLVKAINGEFAPGYHEVRIKNNELPSAGIYYYTLEAGEFTATKKMILIE